MATALDTPTTEDSARAERGAPQPAGLGCGALFVSALIVFGYALYKYQASTAPEATEAEALAAPPTGPASPPPTPTT